MFRKLRVEPMFCKKIAAAVFLLALFSVFASAQTDVPDEATFKSAYWAGGTQNLRLTNNLVLTGGIGDPGGNLIFDVDLQSKSIIFQDAITTVNGAMFRLWNIRNSYSNGTVTFQNNYAKGFFSYDAVNHSSSVANGNGGAMYVGGEFIFQNSTANFINNRSEANGGAISDYGTIKVINSNILFYGNQAASKLVETGVLPNLPSHGGAAEIRWGATFNVISSTVTFDSNKTDHNGGAVYVLEGASLNFTDSVGVFTNNITKEIGGAGYLYGGGVLSINNSKVDFTGNKAGWVAGALQVDGSTVTVVGSTVNFTGNQAGAGGAINFDIWSGRSSVDFTNSSVYFTSNTATATTNGNGGAIYNNLGSLTFNPGAGNEVVFANNTAAGSGNDIYQTADAATTVKGLGKVVIGGGIAGAGLITKEGGGILYINGNSSGYAGTYTQSSGTVSISTGFFSGTNNINGGTAQINDGAVINSVLNMAANTLLNINVTGSFNLRHSSFSGTAYNILKTNTGTLNIAEDYSANTGTFTQEAGITNVSANYFSGASNINGGTLNFNTGTTKAGGNIALASPATLNITGTDTLALSGAVSGTGAINKTGSGTLKLSGNNSGYSGVYTQSAGSSIISAASFSGVHNITGGSMEWATGTVLSAGSTFSIGSNVLNITDAQDITVSGGQVTTSVSGIINKTGAGKLIFAGDTAIAGTLNGTAGEVVLTNGAGYTGGNVNMNGATFNMNDGAVNTVNLTGNFTSLTNLKMDIFSGSLGNDQIQCSSASLGGNIDIFAGVGTYNQKEYDLIITGGSGSLLNKFASSSIKSADSSGLGYEIKYEDGIVKLILNGVRSTNLGSMDPRTYNQKQTAKTFDKMSINPPAQWALILGEMANKASSGSEEDANAVLNFLSRTSGYFLSNVVRNMAADSPNNEVYDKIRNHAEEHITNSGLWVQARGGLETFKDDENSLLDYRDLSYGVMFGFDRFLTDKFLGGDLMWGVYGRINKDNVEQDENRASGLKNGLGLYGGYITDSWELKAMLLGSYDRFSTRRMTYGGSMADADITGVTVSGDIEAAIKIWASDNMAFRPYAGVEAANSMYGAFKESGGGMYALNTDAGNYFRSSLRVGAGLDYEKGIWIWYANVEGKYVFEGTKPEITSQFTETGLDFYSRGADETVAQIGLGAGGEVRLSEHWKAFANAKFYMAERYYNIYGNIGVRYMFGKSKGTEEIKDNREENDAKAEKEKRAEAQRQAALEEAQRRADEEAAAQAAALEAQRKADEAAKAAAKLAADQAAAQDISDEEFAKQKAEALERRKKPMLKTYTLTMHFATNEYELSDEDKEQIDEVAGELSRFDYKKITIEGHTDNTGTLKINKRLSRQRAKSVYDEFANNGVPEDKMTYQGFADTMPVKSNATAAGRAANRRTEIFLE